MTESTKGLPDLATDPRVTLGVAFADALLPFAGQPGITTDMVLHSVLALATSIQARKALTGTDIFTMDGLEGIAAKTTADLAEAQRLADAQPK